MSRKVYPHSSRIRTLLFCAILTWTLTGCGTALTDSGNNHARVGAVDVVILDWSDGRSELIPGEDLQGLDFAKFEVSDGTNLSNVSSKFKEAVLEDVIATVNDIPGMRVQIRNGKADPDFDGTIVHIAQALSPDAPGQVGQAFYDPCDWSSDDAAIIFGEEILRTGGPYSFDQWTMMFANATAHEIAHTLGFGHVPREPQNGLQRSAYVELMMATHTVSEMVRPQRYLSDESNCPAATDLKLIEFGYDCGIEQD